MPISQYNQIRCSLSNYLSRIKDHYGGNEIVNGFRLTYGNSGKLARVESPLQNPTYRLDLFYNDEGKVSIEKNY